MNTADRRSSGGILLPSKLLPLIGSLGPNGADANADDSASPRWQDEAMSTGTLPDFDPHDPLGLDALAVRGRDRRAGHGAGLLRRQVTPHIAEWFEDGELPVVRELAKQFGKIGLLGMHLHGYGCGGTSAVDYGLACLELEAADSGMRSLVSVQGSLAMFAIWTIRLRGAKAAVAARMAAGELLGCFGLTEPDAGSDPAAMNTRAARRVGLGPQRPQDVDHQRHRRRRRRGLGADRRGRSAGSSCPPTTPGFSANTIHHKLSLRASVTSELVLDDVRLPARRHAARGDGAQGAAGVPDRGALRDRLGGDGRGALCLADRAGVRRTQRTQFGRRSPGFS